MLKQNHKPSYKLFCYLLMALLVIGSSAPLLAQGVGINEDNSVADTSAILDVKSTTKGMLIPRMTTAQRTTIATPATGLLVYDNTTSSFWFYNGTAWTELVAGSPDQIADADNDTKVQTEKNADEDIVRIDIAGTGHWAFQSGGRLAISNTNNSVFIGDNTGPATNQGNSNIYIGDNVGPATVLGDQNVVIGSNAFNSNTSGSLAVGIGYNALNKNTSGSLNVAVGARVMENNTTASRNTAIGYAALNANTIGTNNTAVGIFSLLVNTSGSSNIAVGRGSLDANTTGNDNTGMGSDALGRSTTGERNVALGNYSLDAATIASDNVAVGYNALTGITTGGTNTAIGTNAGGSNVTGTGNIFIGYNAGSTETGSDKLYIDNSNTTSPLVYGDFSTNRLAINGSNLTRATLNVFGSVSGTYAYRYMNLTTTDNCGSCTGNYSIYAENHIVASEFNAISDARIKHILGVSNGRKDLNTLMRLQVTDYKMKDSVTKGNELHKKLIAQQVKEVYPQAVSLMTDVVPDIYKIADIKQGWVTIKSDVKKGDKVKLIFADRVEMKEVLEATAEGFKVELADEGKVFVFGREVNDFHSVDYEAVSMLNVSATQELYKIIEQLQSQNAKLQAQDAHLQSKVDEMSALKAEVEQLKSSKEEMAALKAEMEALRAMISQQQNGSSSIRDKK